MPKKQTNLVGVNFEGRVRVASTAGGAALPGLFWPPAAFVHHVPNLDLDNVVRGLVVPVDVGNLSQ